MPLQLKLPPQRIFWQLHTSILHEIFKSSQYCSPKQAEVVSITDEKNEYVEPVAATFVSNTNPTWPQ